ncbi:hypothetical protein [uncultured Sulfitobacter sp.]|nr:hypothetical protein [uncultured Sulfitobacter sp.]
MPYIVAGGMLRRAGHTTVLQWVSGGALMEAGGLLLLNITI